ncbi:MAG: PRC-barrel domain-containing protein [Croceibacterium sp.]
MRLSDLRNKKVRDSNGQPLGRVHEVHADGGIIVALVCGPGGMIERMPARRAGRKIEWAAVRRVLAKEIIITAEPARGT